MKRSQRIRITESTLESVGRILSDKYDIKVFFRADQCSTTGSTIFLPVIPEDASEELLHAIQGHLDHEAAHCVFTDFRVMQHLANKPKLLTIWNALEDPRIEHKWVERYPGARLNLDRSSEFCFQGVAKKRPGANGKDINGWDQLSDLGKLLYAGGVCAEFGSDHWFMKEVVEADIRALMPQIVPFFQEAFNAPDSQAAVDVAERMMTKIGEIELEQKRLAAKDIPKNAVIMPPGSMPSAQEQVMNKQPEEDPDAPPAVVMEPALNTEEPDEDESDQPSPSGGQGDAEGDEDAPDKGQGGEDDDEGEEDAGDLGKQPKAGGSDDDGQGDDSQDDQGGKQRGQGASMPTPPRNFNPTNNQLKNDEEIGELRNQIRESLRQTPTDDRTVYRVYTTEGDTIEKIKPGSRVEYGRFQTESRKLVSPMRQKLVRLLNSRKDAHWEGGKLRGKINRRALWRLALGTSKHIFKQRVPGEDLDCAVMIGIDHSESMSGAKIELASRVAGVFGQIFDPLQVPFAVYGWSTGESNVAQERRRGVPSAEQKAYSRYGNLWLGEYKTFSESWSSGGPKVLTMPKHVKANTYDGESVKRLAQMLLRRKERRKILLIFNDGEPYPNWGDDHQAHVNYAHAAAEEVERMVEVVVFGVMTDAVEDIYSNTVVIQNLNDLPRESLTKLSEVLLPGKTGRRPKRRAA